MKKRMNFVSILLAAVMLITVIGGAAFAAPSPFVDVDSGRWSADAIAYVVEKEYMKGVGAGKFDPAGGLTRGMVVTVLYRAEGSPEVGYRPDFKDVPEKEWYAVPVIWAKDSGVVKGTSPETFDPDGLITREQLVTMFMRFSSYRKYKTDERGDLSPFSDVEKIDSYAIEPMAWAVGTGLISGVSPTRLSPLGTATREQFAAIFKRFDERDFEFVLEYNEPVPENRYKKPEYPLADDADFFVSPDGDDSADGSFAHPFATFSRAVLAVRELKKEKAGGITVAFMAGEYGELDNVTFDSEDSGSKECPITYRAYGDGDVVFRNGFVVRSEEFCPITEDEEQVFPEDARDAIKKVDLSGKISSFGQNGVLIGNGRFLWEARYPNKYANGTDRVFTDMTTTVDERASIRLIGPIAATVARLKTVEGMKITGYLRTGWFQDTFPVKSYDSESKIVTFDFENYDWSGTYTLDDYVLAYEGRMEDTVFFHNLAEFLDDSGEYWFDEKTATLYVYDPQGDYSIPTGGTFVTFENGADHISLIGFSFIGTKDVAIRVGSDDVTLSCCRIGDVEGKYAIMCEKIRDFTLSDSELFCFAHGGVKLKTSADPYLLEQCGHVVTNNFFHDFGSPIYFEEEDAVAIRWCVGAVVSHNEFLRGSHGGVRFSYSIDSLIEYNIFDGMMSMTQDFGAVYTYTENAFRSNVIRYNLFKNIRSAGAQHGIYLDGADGQIAYGNLFYNSGTFGVTFNGGRDNDVHDNIFISAKKTSADTFGRRPVMYTAHGYEYAIAEVPTEEQKHMSASLIEYLNDRPSEGEPGYELWRDRWPIMYEYDYDKSHVGEFNCVYTPVNYFRNNKIFGMDFKGIEYYDMFAVKDGTECFGIDENPYFVDPTNGDYRIKDGVEFPDFGFEKMGRFSDF